MIYVRFRHLRSEFRACNVKFSRSKPGVGFRISPVVNDRAGPIHIDDVAPLPGGV